MLSEYAALCPVQLDQVVAVKVKPRPLMHDVCQDLGETSSLITVTHMLVGLIVAIYQLVGGTTVFIITFKIIIIKDAFV